MDHHFQVNLRGIIDLLSNHLYSGPEVFVRELLQNAVDAIHAREKIEPGFEAEINLELTKGRAGGPSTLVVSENGVGLTEEEIHRFLATIGESSKRGVKGERLDDFIGQFGIGLLSCFMVSDEIVVVTRSAKGGSPAMEWRGRADGTYSVKQLEADISPGTQVYLTCKDGAEEFYDRDRLEELMLHYGGLLPYPIRIKAGKTVKHINAEPPPWRGSYPSAKERTKALLAYGRKVFGTSFFDAIPLKVDFGGVDGVAFVLNVAPSATAKEDHRVYLKNMFLSERVGGLLPPWAFFVKLIINATTLKPMASREGFQNDAALERTRDALGRSLRAYLVGLSEHDSEKLAKLISIHDLTIRALAIDDDEFYRIVFDWLPVETSRGPMSLGEYRESNDVLRYAPTLDQFRQIAQVAAAQKVCVINAAYTYVTELIEKYPTVFDGGRVERIEARDVIDAFGELDDVDGALASAFIRRADSILRPFRCHAEIKKFAPADLPALYTTSTEGEFLRSVEQTQDIADSLWSSVMGSIAPGAGSGVPFSNLCFNFDNPIVRGLLGVKNDEVVRRSIQMLYVQALLLGHHPLSAKEMSLLNEGLLTLIELALKSEGGSR